MRRRTLPSNVTPAIVPAQLAYGRHLGHLRGLPRSHHATGPCQPAPLACSVSVRLAQNLLAVVMEGFRVRKPVLASSKGSLCCFEVSLTLWGVEI